MLKLGATACNEDGKFKEIKQNLKKKEVHKKYQRFIFLEVVLTT